MTLDDILFAVFAGIVALLLLIGGAIAIGAAIHYGWL